MTERQRLLIKLLTVNHLNVTERNSMGSEVMFSELLEVAEHYFDNACFLPSVIAEWRDEKLCYDGYSIEKRGRAYILHLQVTGAALNLYANKYESYFNLNDVLRIWLQREFRFVIDGIRIIMDVVV